MSQTCSSQSFPMPQVSGWTRTWFSKASGSALPNTAPPATVPSTPLCPRNDWPGAGTTCGCNAERSRSLEEQNCSFQATRWGFTGCPQCRELHGLLVRRLRVLLSEHISGAAALPLPLQAIGFPWKDTRYGRTLRRRFISLPLGLIILELQPALALISIF